MEVQAKVNHKKNKLLSFIMKHKLIFFLLTIIIVFVLWAIIKMALMERRFDKEKATLVKTYEMRIDSLNIVNMKSTAKVLSWAVRSEMTRNNIEQVNQFFSNYIKEPNIKKIELINPLTSKIILSTDKKTEGEIVLDNHLLHIDETTYESNKIISPIMGLDSKIGILIIDVNIPKIK